MEGETNCLPITVFVAAAADSVQQSTGQIRNGNWVNWVKKDGNNVHNCIFNDSKIFYSFLIYQEHQLGRGINYVQSICNNFNLLKQEINLRFSHNLI